MRRGGHGKEQEARKRGFGKICVFGRLRAGSISTHLAAEYVGQHQSSATSWSWSARGFRGIEVWQWGRNGLGKMERPAGSKREQIERVETDLRAHEPEAAVGSYLPTEPGMRTSGHDAGRVGCRNDLSTTRKARGVERASGQPPQPDGGDVFSVLRRETQN
jgi:hypothetical protein